MLPAHAWMRILHQREITKHYTTTLIKRDTEKIRSSTFGRAELYLDKSASLIWWSTLFRNPNLCSKKEQLTKYFDVLP